MLRCKFGGNGDEDEDDDEVEKREIEENERRAKHSIDGILGDRCECQLYFCFISVFVFCAFLCVSRFLFSSFHLREIHVQNNT